jgi:23S rRNA (cytosine1962-C5)-methyltransferase
MFGKIKLKKSKEKSLMRSHPWVFSGAIDYIEIGIREGDVVEVFDCQGNYLATGHYQPTSIAVRIFSFEKIESLRQLWKTSLLKASRLRKELGFPSDATNAFRLVNAEGDGLPGLVIDYYDGHLVFQAHSAGMFFQLDLFKELLGEVVTEVFGLSLKSVYNKSSQTVPFKVQPDKNDGFVFGGEYGGSQPEIIENNNRFLVDIEGGQKTGLFLDQRDSRNILGGCCENKSVLNTFSYTGGFSVYAFRGNAKSVCSVESSARSVELEKQNVELNFKNNVNHLSYCEDVFKFFHNNGDIFDIIILDPPAFVKHQDSFQQGMRGYEKLNRIALKKIRPGGFLFTFSCSQIVSGDDFKKAVFYSALELKRDLKILHQFGQPADHPFSIYHPEGEYLKGFMVYVA